jgi:hypothetical protein
MLRRVSLDVQIETTNGILGLVCQRRPTTTPRKSTRYVGYNRIFMLGHHLQVVKLLAFISHR